MQAADFAFDLPPDLIAQDPAPRRDQSRLLVLNRLVRSIAHDQFQSLPQRLRPGDLLVLNNAKVLPARLRAVTPTNASEVELLLLEENATNDWWALVRPGKRARLQARLLVRAGAATSKNIDAVVVELNEEGHRRLRFQGTPDIRDELLSLGELPLPPYIKRPDGETPLDRERYQTVYAHVAGSVAAPTAGLHFTTELLEGARQRGARTCFLTLHVGLGTFAPVKAELLSAHRMHEERYVISEECAAAVNQAKQEQRRVIAVGTTTLRALESASRPGGRLEAAAGGRTRLFIHPPHDFQIVDALLTNFHLPRSTLLMLVSAFAAPGQTRGRKLILDAYAQAIRERYRFFSYGDAMFIE